MNIDFVITWVDGSDLAWLKEKNQYSPLEKKINDNNRYRDNDIFNYWFRSVEKYAPWVNKIFLVTEGHLPEWINVNHPKLVHVRHEEFIPKKYLPTFNTNAIEMNVHRIEGLSEHFVLFNDDFFLNGLTNPNDFFMDGMPRDFGIYSIIVPYKEHSIMVFNNVRIINEHFNKKETLKKNWKKFFRWGYAKQLYRTIITLPWKKVTGYYNPHLTSSILKSDMIEIWEEEYDELNKTSMNKFRTSLDLTQWLIRYWQIEKGNFMPQRLSFGKYCEINESNKIIKIMKNEKIKILVINDVLDMNTDIDKSLKDIKSAFENKFPNKSTFEL